MIIRSTGFRPMKVTVDSMETPVQEVTYLDVDGVSRTLDYIVVNGEKVPIQYRAELLHDLSRMKVDETLVKVEEDRKKKIEDAKPK